MSATRNLIKKYKVPGKNIFPGFLFFVPIAIGMLFSSCAFFPKFHSPSKTFFKSIKDQPFDVIIVPGYPHYQNGWSNVVKMRVIWADYLYKKGYTKNIIFSGGSVYTPFIESKIMGMYAEAMGVPKEHIFAEEKAEHSVENVYYSYVMAREMGFKKIALASDQFQTDNLRGFVRKFRLPIKLLPIILDTLAKIDDIPEPRINDSLGACKGEFCSIVARQTLRQRVRGTLGKYIIWHEEDLKKKRFRRRFRHRMIPKGS